MDNLNEKPRATPKDFFLWAGAMVALYVGVFNYIALVWDYINYAIPDPLQTNYYSDPYQSGISWEMATLIILVPVFLALMLLVRRDIARDSSRKEVWVRRWALFLTLFAAGVTIIVDLIWVLYAFLNGIDVTEHFLLKALVVLLVAAIGFMHFLADLLGYWETYPARNRAVAWGVIALVAVTIIAGFFIVGTPAQARLARFDQQKLQDLQQIQSQVINYWQAKQKLPAGLADLENSLSYGPLPVDQQSGQAYGYRVTTQPYSFELCADFNAVSRNSVQTYATKQVSVPVPVVAVRKGGAPDNWSHGVGKTCFERTIDPSFYPPINGKVQP